MRPSIGIANLPKIFAACLGHELCLKALSLQKTLRTFNYSYIHARKYDVPCNFVYLYLQLS